MQPYQALLIVSFGGPEGPDEVLPFLENVLRGKNVPRERLLEVAEHYDHFGGVSPINGQNRALIEALRANFDAFGLNLPIYWGNRNWRPFLPETLRQMAADGVHRAIAFVTSAFSSYSGCRQYRENIADARLQLGAEAPEIDKLRVFFNHAGFIEPMIEHARVALERIPQDRRFAARLVFTAHSIPLGMASGCRYEEQLREASRLVAEGLAESAGARHEWSLVYQSRSGPPTQPWLEPDVGDHLRALASGGVRDVVVVPIGFVSDHLEILYDLDTEAQRIAQELGLGLWRASTVGTHPKFVAMIRELVLERIGQGQPMLHGKSAVPDKSSYLGSFGPSHDICPTDCCPAPVRVGRPTSAASQADTAGDPNVNSTSR